MLVCSLSVSVLYQLPEGCGETPLPLWVKSWKAGCSSLNTFTYNCNYWCWSVITPLYCILEQQTVTNREHAPVLLTYPAARLHRLERGLSRKWCGWCGLRRWTSEPAAVRLVSSRHLQYKVRCVKLYDCGHDSVYAVISKSEATGVYDFICNHFSCIHYYYYFYPLQGPPGISPLWRLGCWHTWRGACCGAAAWFRH